MKLLLIGPFPPPHGGISVHVAEAKKQLDRAGIDSRVLNMNRTAPQSEEYICLRSGTQLLRVLLAHVRQGWTLHLHTNGHNDRSWLIALACGLIGRLAPACLLTVHSGMAPAYLGKASIWRRLLASIACRLHNRVITVNRQIWCSIASLGLPPDSLEVIPAYFPISYSAALPATFADLRKQSTPLISTVLFHRPEYDVDLLIHALSRLRNRYPNARCLIMGGGEQQQEAERLIREEGMEEHVKLLGDVPHDSCLALIAASDLFVRATREDGDSISVREALSLGVPAVVSNVGHRPPGAILFRAGDLDDLVSTMEATLASPRPNTANVFGQATTPNAHRLLEIYNGLAVEGARS
jgi:glycosyltransferase involved in cell wall biosynthesis